MKIADKRKPGPPRIALDSTAAARRSLARLARMRFRGELDSETYRDLIYGLSALLAFDRHLADLRMEERLAAVEEMLANPPTLGTRPAPIAARQAPRRALADVTHDREPADAIAAQFGPIAANAPAAEYQEPAADSVAAPEDGRLRL